MVPSIISLFVFNMLMLITSSFRVLSFIFIFCALVVWNLKSVFGSLFKWILKIKTTHREQQVDYQLAVYMFAFIVCSI